MHACNPCGVAFIWAAHACACMEPAWLSTPILETASTWHAIARHLEALVKSAALAQPQRQLHALRLHRLHRIAQLLCVLHRLLESASERLDIEGRTRATPQMLSRDSAAQGPAKCARTVVTIACTC